MLSAGGSMQISEFHGITQFHDGLAVSEYTNVIPMDHSIIDRQGEQIAIHHEGTPLETFVDGEGNIYAAYSNGVYAWRYTESNGTHSYTAVKNPTGLILAAPNSWTKATFCESSTKPSQVYFCDGTNVYYWNTHDVVNGTGEFEVVQIPIFSDPTAILNPTVIPGEATGIQYGNWPEINSDNYDLSKLLKIESITWFDNRLVLKELGKNIIYLTAIDPSRYFIPGANGYAYYPLGKTITGYDENNQPIYGWVNDFLPSYYGCMTASATLIDVRAFAGQLYLFNDYSIEIWSATGNYDNPIQHNSQATLYYGGRSPVIIADKMYILCKDTIHNDFVAAISQSGQFQKLSNVEIERRFQRGAYRIRPLSVRDQSMIVVYTDDTYTLGYSCTAEGKWWCVSNGSFKDNFIAWTICNKHGTIISVSNLGDICEGTDAHRRFCDGRAIPRWVRGAFIQFAGRKILREVEVICDTGDHYQQPGTGFRPEFYLRVSFDRGLGFGPFLYRKMGAKGTNDRVMIWRNCGSGNSILLEFGTAADTKFQIYGIRFELS